MHPAERRGVGPRFRGCLVDEHYYPTLFAMHNRQDETDCKGVLTVAEFRWPAACALARPLNSQVS